MPGPEAILIRNGLLIDGKGGLPVEDAGLLVRGDDRADELGTQAALDRRPPDSQPGRGSSDRVEGSDPMFNSCLTPSSVPPENRP
jgi:hypothetical protein